MAARLSDQIRARTLSLYQAGLTLRQIATRMQLAQATISQWASEAGLTHKRKQRHTLAVKLACQRDYESGMSRAAIAKKHSVTLGTVKRWIAEYRRDRAS